MSDLSNSDVTVTAYIGLGSNLNDPVQQIQMARVKINSLQSVTETAFSSLYGSDPMGPEDQPDYVNAVMAISTTLRAISLLKELQNIETDQGRVRTGQRWGARTLDLDILLYSDCIINEPDLIVPHPGLTQRPFVLHPLYEIAPDLKLPDNDKSLIELIAQCPLMGLKRLG